MADIQLQQSEVWRCLMRAEPGDLISTAAACAVSCNAAACWTLKGFVRLKAFFSVNCDNQRYMVKSCVFVLKVYMSSGQN